MRNAAAYTVALVFVTALVFFCVGYLYASEPVLLDCPSPDPVAVYEDGMRP